MKVKQRLGALALVLLAATLACGQTPTPEGPCTLTTTNPVTAYNRPSASAIVFGTLDPGMVVMAQARTADGWIGFDPGVAQAGNVGVFRNRWLADSADLVFEGACDDLPVVWGPPPGICFTMFMTDTDIYTGADAASAVLATLGPDDHAQVLGKTASGDWLMIDLDTGNVGIGGTGWAENGSISYNGPCDPQPVLTP